jgi:hypothetical protein
MKYTDWDTTVYKRRSIRIWEKLHQISYPGPAQNGKLTYLGEVIFEGDVVIQKWLLKYLFHDEVASPTHELKNIESRKIEATDCVSDPDQPPVKCPNFGHFPNFTSIFLW